MKYVGCLITVKDLKASRKFYEETLNQKVKYDFGENIVFESGFSLQSQAAFVPMVGLSREEILYKPNNFELYFEEEEFDSFMRELKKNPDMQYVHQEKEHPWGQRAVRIYDPDMNMIEIAEPMETVIKKLLKSGATLKQAADKTGYSVESIEKLAKEKKF